MLFRKWFLPFTAAIPFSFIADFLKILGVRFGAEGAALKSWEERMSKMKQKFRLWSLRIHHQRKNTMFQYLTQAWSPWVNTCKSITGAVFYFIWGSKMNRAGRGNFGGCGVQFILEGEIWGAYVLGGENCIGG